MAALGRSTKIGFGEITGRSAASGDASQVRYDWNVTWVHGASGQQSGTDTEPFRGLPDDGFVRQAAEIGNGCRVELRADGDLKLFVETEIWDVTDCP